MQLEVNVENIQHNIKKAEKISKRAGIDIAIMIKDFYSDLKIQDNVYNQIWSSKSVFPCRNYILFQTYLARHTGGLIVTIGEVKKLSKECKRFKIKFQGFIPVNMFDDREGLSLDKAIELMNHAKFYENQYFNLKAVSITNGCLKDDLFSIDALKFAIIKLKSHGVNYISVGGSYYLGKLLDGEVLKGIDEIRIGEYAIFGTIPFHDTKKEDVGLNSLIVKMEVIQIYEDRKQVLLFGGSTQIDTDKSEIFTKGYKFVSISTEYTVLQYDNKPKLGDMISFIPNYHSMIKLLY